MKRITTSKLAAQLIGRKIVAVQLGQFDDGRGGRAYDPALILDDGSELTFHVQETDTGTYGITIDRSSPVWTVAPSKPKRRR